MERNQTKNGGNFFQHRNFVFRFFGKVYGVSGMKTNVRKQVCSLYFCFAQFVPTIQFEWSAFQHSQSFPANSSFHSFFLSFDRFNFSHSVHFIVISTPLVFSSSGPANNKQFFRKKTLIFNRWLIFRKWKILLTNALLLILFLLRSLPHSVSYTHTHAYSQSLIPFPH